MRWRARTWARQSPAIASIFLRPIFSSEVLEAKAGVYSQFEVQRGLPVDKLLVKFDQVGETCNANGIAQHGAMPSIPPSDFSRSETSMRCFCSNALIYFDQDNKIAVLNRISR